MIAREWWLRRGMGALAIVFAFVNGANAQKAKQAGASPTCALIDFDRSPLAAVLEAKMLADVEATWLERNTIDEVVKEQELQALFTPEAGAQRAALGKLLKADLLILVRDALPPPRDKSAKTPQGEKPVQAIELAVTETRRGLRFLSRSVPRSDDAEADADILVRLVREAFAKYAQRVTEIYAVPPFVSRDLGYEHDYLRGAYARLLEQMLLDRPGALVVELAEAQSLAKEVALADPGSRLKRDVPFYLLGEYRNDGTAGDRRVRLSLKLMRGEQQLDERSLDRIVPGEAASTIRKLAGELVNQAAGATQVVVDPAAEIEALNRREKLFLRLGQWSDALALAEASLLLKPGQTDMHHDATLALARLSTASWENYPFQSTKAWLTVGYQNRGLEHIESFARLAGRPENYNEQGVGGFIGDFFHSTGGNVRVNQIYPKERNEAIVALQKGRRAALLRIIPLAARAGWKNDHFLLTPLLYPLATQDRFDDVLQLIDQVKDVPDTKMRALWYARSIGLGPEVQTARQRQQALKPFVERLAMIDNADVQAVAKQFSRDLESLVKQEEAKKAAEMAASLREATARAKAAPLTGVREIDFAWRAGTQTGRIRAFDGCLPAGPGVDVVWQGGDIFLMKEPGRMKRVWQSELNSRVTMIVANGFRDHICYDGKFIWATIGRHLGAAPWLMAIDPVSEQLWGFSVADGLPDIERAAEGANYMHFYAVAPIRPGKVCLAGFFGKSWLAMAELDSAGQKSVKTFHEAREAFDRESKSQPLGTAVAFQPSYMFSLADASTAPGELPLRVLVGRGGVQWDCPPLVVDPRTLAVMPVPTAGHLENTMQQHSRKADIHQGAVFLVNGGPAPARKPALYRFALPELAPEVVIEDVARGIVVFHGGLLHIVGREWWTGRLEDKRLHRVAGPLPWSFPLWWFISGRPPEPPETPESPRIERIYHSNHYGLLVKRANSSAREAAVFDVSGLLEAAADVASSANESAGKSAASLPEKASE